MNVTQAFLFHLPSINPPILIFIRCDLPVADPAGSQAGEPRPMPVAEGLGATGGTTTGHQNGAPQRGGHNGEATTGRPQRGGHNGATLCSVNGKEMFLS